jgi:hypothetical protein
MLGTCLLRFVLHLVSKGLNVRRPDTLQSYELLKTIQCLKKDLQPQDVISGAFQGVRCQTW